MGSIRKCGAIAALAFLVPATAGAQDSTTFLPPIDVWASRTGAGIIGASNSVITAEEISRSPGTTLQDVLSREAGIQTWSTTGGNNGATTVVDLRGFGSTASSNTLFLLNGRRLNDIDILGVDLSTIPKESIERIEITRGNSGAVLYGAGAVGGVINIITKTGVGLPPTARIETGFGSFNQAEVNGSAAVSHGPFSASIFANGVNSDGYRVNSALQQRNAVGDLRYNGSDGSAWVNIVADDQHLGLPGARLVDQAAGINELVTDRRGATTPNAFADKTGAGVTLGVSRKIGDSVEVIVDGNLRRKEQKAFSSLFGFDTSDARELTTAAITPRAIIDTQIAGMPTKVIAGFDYYDSQLEAKRSVTLNDPPIHTYNLQQQSTAAYAQQTLAVLPTTDLSWGGRLEQTRLSAHDTFDPTAPGAFPLFDAQAIPLDQTETNYAAHFGFEHRFSPMLAVFGRVAHSFRTPNVDERVGVSAFPVDFDLKTQTSRDIEGGLRGRFGRLAWQASVYDMRLTNEILFIPFPPIGANINLDPTRRYGVETAASLDLTDTVRLKGALSYTRAKFREGIYAGNDVPLVSRWFGNIGVSADLYQKYVVFDAVLRYVGERRMDNDQANFQPLIPAHTTLDIRLGGQIQKLIWSVSVQNLFNVLYFDYAVASSATFGRYNAYPLPGRTFLLKAGVTF
ncbi:MAG TPA: TonB-dependent receptor [Pseudolabrys sp.]|jgi:iron complex outermembrane receptor protein